MSKSVRLKDHLVAEVERLAKEERRSLAQMVEILLEQALRMDLQVATKEWPVPGGVAQTTTMPRAERRNVQDAGEDHFKPDFKK